MKFIHQKAFSVIELLVVIAVVSIVAAIGLPAISNFGVAENNENDKAIIRSQINYVRQLAIENGNAYRIKIINNAINNSSQLESLKISLNRFNKQFHKISVPPCSQFSETSNEGFLISDLTKKAEHYVITKCDSLMGTCNAVTNSNNYFCILPDGSGVPAYYLKYNLQKMINLKYFFYIFMKQVFLI